MDHEIDADLILGIVINAITEHIKDNSIMLGTNSQHLTELLTLYDSFNGDYTLLASNSRDGLLNLIANRQPYTELSSYLVSNGHRPISKPIVDCCNRNLNDLLDHPHRLAGVDTELLNISCTSGSSDVALERKKEFISMYFIVLSSLR